MLINIQSAEELELLLLGHEVVIDFYADWCPPCRQLMPILEKISDSQPFMHSIKFAKVNISGLPELAKKYEISSIPTLVFISQKHSKTERHSGLLSEENLIDALEKFFF
ncbi:thioredoxin family protein [Mycoplasma parvum]|uniref:Thioredoxin n=1 Tax=Mycoplasma parvum str. Indiana TaxID=1403316 RepID=U5NFA5_9MOLU|nr:thioredoxin family protein [Mycoplasma parvum]AGX88888.1 hypothetical protein PRV_00600 [Mycoplasma parvum str. Indiana]